ncbi:hypothetical protein ADT71_02435 [Novosphingobium sp. ST904]|nr:hypothetical protein ADT71_02435 [Novosphingobium sp. ST904]
MHVAMLDMGNRKYGDCTYCEIDGKRILIDGAHKGDEACSTRMPASLPDQLKELTGNDAPYDFDLIVITHCHSDHIGCIPELVAGGTIRAKWALLADARMGFGVPLEEEFPCRPTTPLERVTAALQEETLPDSATTEEVRALIDTAATLQERYAKLLTDLEDCGTVVVQYGRDPHYRLEKAFEGCGFKILGPEVDQLLLCADRIERERRKKLVLPDAVTDQGDEVEIYRFLAKRLLPDGGLEDGATGAALNNQSIVLRIGTGPRAVLLTGDMQFAAPGIGGLRQRMVALRNSVSNAGPYAFVRLSHHGAANGTDNAFLDAVHETSRFGISTGAGDPGHPSEKVLKLLSDRSSQIEWARTDRNGLVSLRLDSEDPRFEIARGELSDAGVDKIKPASSKAPAKRPRHRRVPPTPQPSPGASRLAGLPRLTFVTHEARLKARIGGAADQSFDLIRASGHQLVDLVTDMTPFDVARLASGSAGVVILGGYSVIPALSVDTLPPRIRRQIENARHADPDNYVVWSDDPYGDLAGRGAPDLPVSRIPDGGCGAGFLNAWRRWRKKISPRSACGIFGGHLRTISSQISRQGE